MKKRLTYNNGLKKSVGLVVLLMMVMLMLPTVAMAEDFSYDGLYYSTLTYNTVAVVKPTEGKYEGDITIPETVTYGIIRYRVTAIGDGAFQNASVTSVTLPLTSISSIGEFAFNDCRNLTEFTLPASITSIGKRAFFYCDNLEHLYVHSTDPASYNPGSEAFSNIIRGGNVCTLHVPTGCTAAYTADATFSAFKQQVAEFDPPQSYDLYIAGTQVTDLNAMDILDDGAVSYDPSTKTLTLKGNISPSISYGDCIIVNEENVTIEVAEPCTISAESGIYFTKDATITGSSLLTINSIYGGIWMNESSLTIKDADLLIEDNNSQGIYSSGGDLTIQSSTVNVSAPDDGSIMGWNNLTLIDCYIETPEQGEYNTYNNRLEDKNGNTAYEVRIEPGSVYNIYVAGTRVSEENASDILGDGAVSYDASTKTLTLKGNISSDISDACIIVKEENVTIEVAEPCTIDNSEGGIRFTKDATITGSSLLTINSSNAGIRMNKGSLTIKNANLHIENDYSPCICGSGGNLTIQSSTVNVSSLDYNGSIYGWNDLTLIDCYIETPENGVYKTSKKRLEDEYGEVAQEVSIKPGTPLVYYNLYVAGTRVTSYNASDILGNGNVIYDEDNNKLIISGNITASGSDVLGTGISSNIEELTVQVSAPTTITATEVGIYFEQNATITGASLLTVKNTTNNLAIVGKNDVTIKNANLSLTGQLASWGERTLTIQSSTIDITSSDFSAINGWSTMKKTGCYIETPENGVYNISNKQLEDKNGNKAKTVRIVSILEDNDLAFSKISATATMGQPFTEPTLTNPHSFAVTYSSSKPEVAKVDEKTGKVTLVSIGKTTITASYAGNATYKAGDVSYMLTVKAAKGDVNHDGKIDQTDVALTAQHILGKKPAGFFEASAHMNNDGVINATDLVLIVAEANKP